MVIRDKNALKFSVLRGPEFSSLHYNEAVHSVTALSWLTSCSRHCIGTTIFGGMFRWKSGKEVRKERKPFQLFLFTSFNASIIPTYKVFIKFADDTYLVISAANNSTRAAEIDNTAAWATENNLKLECGPMPNVMAALPNIGGALCSTPNFG